MSHSIQLTGISGSLRKDSFETVLVHAVSGIFPEHLQMKILSITDLPIYNADPDRPAVAYRPSQVADFRKKLAKVDALLIVSPELTIQYPGIEECYRLDFPWRGLPIAGETCGHYGRHSETLGNRKDAFCLPSRIPVPEYEAALSPADTGS